MDRKAPNGLQNVTSGPNPWTIKGSREFDLERVEGEFYLQLFQGLDRLIRNRSEDPEGFTDRTTGRIRVDIWRSRAFDPEMIAVNQRTPVIYSIGLSSIKPF